MSDQVRRMVRRDKIGVYVLYHYSSGETDTMYVGRTEDRPVRERLLEHAQDGECTHFKFQYCSKKREAYEAECELWHALQPIYNVVHPQKPAGKNWACPVRDCEHA